MREAQALSKLKHKHIVQMLDYNPHKNQLIVVMEFLWGGELTN